jgi:hypothetical protein
VYVLVQPAPVPLFTVSEYVPVPEVFIAGTEAVADDAPVIAAGPVHEYPVTLAGEFATKDNVLLAHNGEFVDMLLTVGAALTVTVVAEKQPPAMLYEMFAVPTPTPVTTPVPETTEAIDGLLLLHVPPDTLLARVDEPPGQRTAVPVLAGGLVQRMLNTT